MNTEIPKGTLVRVRTTNGGDTVARLCAAYRPTYTAFLEMSYGSRFSVSADRLKSIEVVGEPERDPSQGELFARVATFDIVPSGGGWIARDRCSFNPWGDSETYTSPEAAATYAARADAFKCGRSMSVRTDDLEVYHA